MSVNLIEISRRNYFPYLVLPHPMKMALLSPESRQRLDRINRGFNEQIYSGDTYWIPYTRRFVPSPERRVVLERSLGRVPIFRHLGAVLAMEARRNGSR